MSGVHNDGANNMLSGPLYVVIIDGRQRREEMYYVADRKEMKVEGAYYGTTGVRHNMPNSFRLKDGGARVSQFYRSVDTAVQHAKELNEHAVTS